MNYSSDGKSNEPPKDFDKLLQILIQEKTKGFSAKSIGNWWDCFVSCLERENPSVKEKLVACTAVCLAFPGQSSCISCIIGTGAVAWYQITKCAWECQ